MSEEEQEAHLAYMDFIDARREQLLDALVEQKANTPEAVVLLSGVL